MRRRLPNGLSVRAMPEWLSRESAEAEGRSTPQRTSGDASPRYDFHGLFSVKVAHRGLRAVLERELSAFRSDGESADLVVEEGTPDAADDRLGLDYAYGEGVLVTETESGRVQIADGYVRAEPGVSGDVLLSQYVENFLQEVIPQRGACIVHSSAVSKDGVGLLFPAWRHTGKTAVALELVQHGYSFMADDWTIVTSAGDLLAYPRWLRLFLYNFELHPFLARNIPPEFGGPRLRRNLVLRRFASSLRPTNWIASRIRRELEDRFFVYAQVPVSVAIPNARTELRSKLTKACLLTSSAKDPWTIEETTAERLAQKIAASANYERMSFVEHGLAQLYTGRASGPRDLVQEYVRILRSALKDAVCLEMRIPTPIAAIQYETIEGLLHTF